MRSCGQGVRGCKLGRGQRQGEPWINGGLGLMLTAGLGAMLRPGLVGDEGEGEGLGEAKSDGRSSKSRVCSTAAGTARIPGKMAGWARGSAFWTRRWKVWEYVMQSGHAKVGRGGGKWGSMRWGRCARGGDWAVGLPGGWCLVIGDW
jgi:hypothetical protein